MHQSSDYVKINLYLFKKKKEKTAAALIICKAYIVENLQINMLLNVDVLRNKLININYFINIAMFYQCNSIEILIMI